MKSYADCNLSHFVQVSSTWLMGVIAIQTLVLSPLVHAAEKQVKNAPQLFPLLENHCVKCHGKSDKVKGDINLLKLNSSDKLSSNPALIKEMIDVLDAGDMPPEGEPPLAETDRSAMIAELKNILVTAKSEARHAEVRRLNRFQYNYAVRDLFKLNRDVFSLPERLIHRDTAYEAIASGKMPDEVKVTSRAFFELPSLSGVDAFPQDLRAEHGFDNQADGLSLSPLLMESFLALSGSIVNSPDVNPDTCGIWHEFFAEPKNTDDLPGVVRERLRKFLTRAFRMPVDEGTLDRYTRKALAAAEKASFTDGMKTAASAALASPRFFYLYNTAHGDGDPADYQFDLASRLSFFLWSSIPDDEMLKLAASGSLSKPDVLERTVNRMMSDKKVLRFCDSFAAQWLQLTKIRSAAPDPKANKNYYQGNKKMPVGSHMVLEPLLLFESVYVENRPVVELLDPDTTYRSLLLDAWYSEGFLKGSKVPRTKLLGEKKFLKVDNVPFARSPIQDRRFGGILNNAAVMTMTSGPQETHPITRGAWILEAIFNDPPPPPPPNVPLLDENIDPAKIAKMTLRERFAVHRTDQNCAGCHSRLDPLGFALEHFDVTGRWRDKYANGLAIDADGKLFKKHAFSNGMEFKDALKKEEHRFVRGLSGHLMKYALSRKLTARESVGLDHIVENTKPEGHRLRSMIKQVALSKSFTRVGQQKGRQ